MAEVPSKSRCIRITEQGLRRFALRQADPSFVFDGSKVRIRLEQPLFPAAPGEDPPIAYAMLEGRREFGGRVAFDVPPKIEVEGVNDPQDLESLRSAAEEFLEVFEQLCRCGQFPEACDCCNVCSGAGHAWDPTADEVRRCRKCHARGYLGSDDLAASDP